MTVNVTTSTPAALLAKIKRAIDDGHVDTWSYDKDGDFTHTPPQWVNQAWLRPSTGAGLLTLSLIGRTDTPITTTIYAVYHGRFIEMLLAHFDDDFTPASATAKQA